MCRLLPHGIKNAVSKAHHQSSVADKAKTYLISVTSAYLVSFIRSYGILLTTMIAILPPTSPTTVMGGFSLGISTDQWQFFIFYFFYRGRKKEKKEGLYNLLQVWKCQLCMGHHCLSEKWGDNCSNYHSVAGKSTKILILFFFFKLSEEVLSTCRERHAGTTSSISLLKPKLGFHAMKFCWHSYRSHPRSARIPCQGLWHWSGSTQSQLSSAY